MITMAKAKRKFTGTKVTSADLYKEIADKILVSLMKGVRPWESCYSVGTGSGFATRVTGDQYKGINRMLLTMAMWEAGYTHPVFMTFNQARELGGSINKGEKSHLSVFFKQHEIDEIDPMTGEKKIVPVIKGNRVFNVAQISGLSDAFLSKFINKVEINDFNPIERAEAFIKNLPVEILEKDSTPCYIPSKDIICMPKIGQFKTVEQYYATLLHEEIHSTGHKSRLNRFETERNKKSYAKEEVTAELGAAFLLPSLGLEPLIDDEHSPYINDYIQVLKDDPKAFLTACSKAEKAADWLIACQDQAKEEKAA